MIEKLIYIASCPHSGSTVTELLLSSHSAGLGIGESFKAMEPLDEVKRQAKRFYCACGERIEQCEFWSDVLEEFEARRNLSPRQKYGKVFEQVGERYPEKTVLIDSSKQISTLKTIADVCAGEIELYVLHLVRDVRAYSFSMHRRYKQRERPGLLRVLQSDGPKGAVRRLRNFPIGYFIDWEYHNQQIANFLRERGMRAMTVSYEGLCFDPEGTLRRISEFAGLDFEFSMTEPKNAFSHNIFGNRMRHDRTKRRQFRYDSQWMYSRDWLMPYLVLPHIAAQNRRFRDEHGVGTEPVSLHSVPS